MSNRRFLLVRDGAAFRLESENAPIPSPGAGEVLVRMHAVSLNRRDLMIRDGQFYAPPGIDRFTPLSDGAGEVVAVGEGVTSVTVGDRVASTFFQNWAEGPITQAARTSAMGLGGAGAFAQYVVLKAHGVSPIPDDWSYDEGATIPCAAVTAWSAMVRLGQMQPGQSVLIIGTGGVAIFAIQIAWGLGGRPVVLSSSEDKLVRARDLGAAVTLNYRETPDWAERVKAETGGLGVDQALELGGGTLPKTLASMAVGGQVALIGALDGPAGDIPARALAMSALRVCALSVGSRADQVAVFDFLARLGLRPVIDTVFQADQADAAFDRLKEGAFGKVVVQLG